MALAPSAASQVAKECLAMCGVKTIPQDRQSDCRAGLRLEPPPPRENTADQPWRLSPEQVEDQQMKGHRQPIISLGDMILDQRLSKIDIRWTKPSFPRETLRIRFSISRRAR